MSRVDLRFMNIMIYDENLRGYKRDKRGGEIQKNIRAKGTKGGRYKRNRRAKRDKRGNQRGIIGYKRSERI